MWLIGRIRASSDDPVENEMERLILAEAEACSYCRSVLRLTGMLPVVCSQEDVVRDYTWIQDIQERAEMAVQGRLLPVEQVLPG